MIAAIATILAPVALIIGAGIGWDRIRGDFDSSFVTDLVYFVGAPALVFSALTSFDFASGFGAMALAAASAIAAMGVAGALALRLLGLSRRAYLPAVMFPNLGNMGLPLCLFAFGEVGLAQAVVVFAVGSLAHYTVGVWILSGRISPATVLKAPVAYAGLAALAFHWSDAAPPSWLANTAGLLGDLSIPLLLLALGVLLSRLRIGNVARGVQIAVLRLGIGFAVGLALAAAFGFEGTARGVLILNCTMPSAVFSYLLAARFQAEPEDVAGGVALSTAASFVLLPFVLAFLL